MCFELLSSAAFVVRPLSRLSCSSLKQAQICVLYNLNSRTTIKEAAARAPSAQQIVVPPLKPGRGSFRVMATSTTVVDVDKADSDAYALAERRFCDSDTLPPGAEKRRSPV
jgi:hypothetical protein